jgi:hypothetical protein
MLLLPLLPRAFGFFLLTVAHSFVDGALPLSVDEIAASIAPLSKLCF